MMRIIAGKLKGRTLQGPRGADLRPTSDRLKETLFNILGSSVEGTVVLDVFSGTGALGLEAFSRGAREIVFIDSSREAARLMRRNLELLGITSGYRIVPEDVFTSLRSLARAGFRADIVLLDPPYRWGPYADLLGILFQTGIASRETRVILEHHSKADVPVAGPGFHCVRTVRQGDKGLSFYSADIGEAVASRNRL
jgi:16S rRNA (guanine966-N2)-methyltransferase